MFSLNTYAWMFASWVAYLAFYTAYDKHSKSLSSVGLLDVLLARKGIDHTLVQLNKVNSYHMCTEIVIICVNGLDNCQVDDS